MSACRKALACLVATHALVNSSLLFAEGVSPYLPEKLSPLLENEVERLAIVAGMPNLIRPYSIATIFHYMEKIKRSHPRLYSRINLSLKPYARKIALTHGKISASYSNEEHPIPNGRGNTVDMLASVTFRGQWQIADWFGFYVGAHLSEYRGSEEDDSDSENEDFDVYQASGSTISFGFDWAQLDVGYRDMWLSPFQGSAQLLSTQAQTMPSVSLSNNLPIQLFDMRWNYLAFLTEMSRQPVLFEGEFNDKDKPLIAGIHVGVQPVEWWSIGATRVFQFGGGERSVSFRTLAEAFFDPRGADNDAESDEESGNQIAAVVSKINFDGRLPFSFAVELAGEDTSNNKNYQLGNTSLTAGVFFPYFFSQDLSVTYEYSDWQDGWYVNNVYSKGYSNEHYVLGHWAMQVQQGQNIAVEGTSQFFKTQWQTPNDRIISLSVRYSDHEDTAEVEFEEGWEIDLEYSIPLGTHIFSLSTYIGKDNLGEDFNQLKLSLEW